MALKLGAKSTAAQVLAATGADLRGKHVVVTGCSSGIGVECVRVFANAGAHVFALGRDVPKTIAVVSAINEECRDPGRVSVVPCDLSNLTSVREAAAFIISSGFPVSILLNNAGVMAIPDRRVTKDGLEMQFGTNHVGHFVLTNELAAALKAGAPSRIVNVSSMAHRRNGIVWDDIMLERDGSYNDWKAYGQSKTANILHAVALHSRLGPHGVTSVSLHPGVIHTELWRHSATKYPDNKTVEQGAATSVFCALSAGVSGGKFYSDCAEAPAAPYAVDPSESERLWVESEKIVKALATGS